MKNSYSLAALFCVAVLPFTNAFFRVTCAPYKRERIDALISPGQESSHMHTFWGGRNIGSEPITSEELRQGCSSCDNQLDTSAYWIPTLYYVKKGVPVPVKVSIFHVYYQGQDESLDPFPEDYSVVAGSPDRTEDEMRKTGGGGFQWHYEDSDEEKEVWELPKKYGNGWLRGNVPFPSWVVKDVSLGRYRECTTQEEQGCQKVMSMFFAIWYDARDAEFYTFEDGDHLILSSGGGHTYHGDFVYGWDKSVATEIVRNQTEFARIGGESAYIATAACNATANATPYLGDLDTAAKKAAEAGNVTFVTGTYNIGLTITDGKSINSTWTGDGSGDDYLQPSSLVQSSVVKSAVASSSNISTAVVPSVSSGSSLQLAEATSHTNTPAALSKAYSTASSTASESSITVSTASVVSTSTFPVSSLSISSSLAAAAHASPSSASSRFRKHQHGHMSHHR